ncbi:hypothetical protein [endosymbiont of Acanthamoeba sp. UWC8]|uniref:hypothetical protein n=1 Tax=endosymbiont of Acanthamoeba sp. UWC8 TaxID=86106 RepID=UPI000571CBE3|nr:hypothetical protein [endosymbiont of Acanthamoeba sp. UWC8]
MPATILKDRFDLPELPNHISDVNPPIGTKIAAGIVEEGNFNQDKVLNERAELSNYTYKS